MEDKKLIEKAKETYTVTFPFSDKEKEKLRRFLDPNGIKVGIFVRRAVLKYLDRQEQEMVRE